VHRELILHYTMRCLSGTLCQKPFRLVPSLNNLEINIFICIVRSGKIEIEERHGAAIGTNADPHRV
jgi:hypothetical protein